MPDPKHAKLQEILKKRDLKADAGALGDAAINAFDGIEKVFERLRLLYDDERTQIPVKARILEVVLDAVKEGAKSRMPSNPADEMSDEEILKVIRGLQQQLPE